MRPCVVLSYFQGGIELSLDLVCRRYLNKRKTPQLVVNAMGNYDFFVPWTVQTFLKAD